MPRLITTFSGKGGVGKTNTSANLAAAMAKRGKVVLVCNADLTCRGIARELRVMKALEQSGKNDLYMAATLGGGSGAYIRHHMYAKMFFAGVKRRNWNSFRMLLLDRPESMLSAIRAIVQAIEADDGLSVDVVIIDCGASLDSATLAALKITDLNLAIMLPEARSLEALVDLVEIHFRDYEVAMPRISLVPNRIQAASAARTDALRVALKEHMLNTERGKPARGVIEILRTEFPDIVEKSAEVAVRRLAAMRHAEESVDDENFLSPGEALAEMERLADLHGFEILPAVFESQLVAVASVWEPDAASLAKMAKTLRMAIRSLSGKTRGYAMDMDTLGRTLLKTLEGIPERELSQEARLAM